MSQYSTSLVLRKNMSQSSVWRIPLKPSIRKHKQMIFFRSEKKTDNHQLFKYFYYRIITVLFRKFEHFQHEIINQTNN